MWDMRGAVAYVQCTQVHTHMCTHTHTCMVGVGLYYHCQNWLGGPLWGESAGGKKVVS